MFKTTGGCWLNMFTIQDWKRNGTLMGQVRAYDPTPTQQGGVDLQNFPLKLAQVKLDSGKRGVEKYRVTLSNQVRSSHLSDPVNGPNWRDLVLDFDKKFLWLYFILFQKHKISCISM